MFFRRKPSRNMLGLTVWGNFFGQDRMTVMEKGGAGEHVG